MLFTVYLCTFGFSGGCGRFPEGSFGRAEFNHGWHGWHGWPQRVTKGREMKAAGTGGNGANGVGDRSLRLFFSCVPKVFAADGAEGADRGQRTVCGIRIAEFSTDGTEEWQ